MSREREFVSLLRASGAVLVRTRKHRCYRLSSGRTFVASSSPSDQRALKNSLSVLRRLVRETA